MRDAGRETFAATGVANVSSPEAFARGVRTEGWEPIDASPRIDDPMAVIANLGGARLYGDKPEIALRELIQNGADAVRARRALGGLEPDEGRIDVELEPDGQGLCWLHVTDTGIGMSRYVLCNVLLDFGRSLWGDAAMRSELPGLAAARFNAVGQFGIGFFSVFMLGEHVRVVTRRYEAVAENGGDGQWLLDFETGLKGRPVLRKPKQGEKLQRAGTRVSVAMDAKVTGKLLNNILTIHPTVPGFHRVDVPLPHGDGAPVEAVEEHLEAVVGRQCPTLDVQVRIRVPGGEPKVIIEPRDWETMDSGRLLSRCYSGSGWRNSTLQLVGLREPTTGALVGRVGLGGVFDNACITHQGIAGGHLGGCGGVLVGGNSPDLTRQGAKPIASLDAWTEWAARWLDQVQEPDYDQLVMVYPLCPERELSVYKLGEEIDNRAQLTTGIAPLRDLYLTPGPIEYDGSDDVAEGRFYEDIEVGHNVLQLPAVSRLCAALGVPPVPYADLIRQCLKEVWGDFQEEEVKAHCVGDVSGTSIFRPVTRFTRIKPKPED